MKLTQLLSDLQQVDKVFPDAEIRLGYCSCCIYIEIEGKEVCKYNSEMRDFEYFARDPEPPQEIKAAMTAYLEREKKKK